MSREDQVPSVPAAISDQKLYLGFRACSLDAEVSATASPLLTLSTATPAPHIPQNPHQEDPSSQGEFQQLHQAAPKPEAADGAEMNGGAWVSWGSAQRVGQGKRKYLRSQAGRGESRTRTGGPAAGAACSTPHPYLHGGKELTVGTALSQQAKRVRKHGCC